VVQRSDCSRRSLAADTEMGFESCCAPDWEVNLATVLQASHFGKALRKGQAAQSKRPPLIFYARVV
jgi:hypothetical protein